MPRGGPINFFTGLLQGAVFQYFFCLCKRVLAVRLCDTIVFDFLIGRRSSGAPGAYGAICRNVHFGTWNCRRWRNAFTDLGKCDMTAVADNLPGWNNGPTLRAGLVLRFPAGKAIPAVATALQIGRKTAAFRTLVEAKNFHGLFHHSLSFSDVLWDITMTISPNNGKVN